MSITLSDPRLSLLHNPAAAGARVYGAREQAVLDRSEFMSAKREIVAWPGYAKTSLLSLDGLATAAGLGKIWYKDEGDRFGLGSFKSLGGAYATSRLLSRHVEAAIGRPVSSAELESGVHRDLTAGITVTTATDGNHGRSVAWGAQTFGCRCVIFVHAHVSRRRQSAMEAFGAEVRRVAGNYDDSVRAAAETAAAEGYFVVSDTSYAGYMQIPKEVMQGYSLLADEVIDQLPGGERPTHVFIQGGVGGLAAAVCARLWREWGADRPRFVVVEPLAAACLYETARNGRFTVVEGELDTVMAGLATGEVSPLAWEVLDGGVDDFMCVSDAAAEDVMRLLAQAHVPDTPVVAGESAVAGLAAAIGALASGDLTTRLELSAKSRILVVGSEGDTDPEVYQRIVGMSAAEVRAN